MGGRMRGGVSEGWCEAEGLGECEEWDEGVRMAG